MSLLLCATLSLGASAQAQDYQAAASKALAHVRANAAEIGVEARDASSMAVSDAYVSKRTGATHVYLQQEHQSIPVHNAILSTAVDRNGKVAYVSGRLVPGLASKITASAPGISAEDAVKAAAQHLRLTQPEALRVLTQEPGRTQKTVLSPAGISATPIETELVYQPMESGEVRLAWQVTVDVLGAPNWWQVRLDAATGEVLDQNDLVDHDTWGAPAAASAETPGTHRPNATGEVSSIVGALSAGAPMPDSYRVFPFPFESPQHGASHVLVTNPINDAPSGTYPGSTTSWHDTDNDGAANFTDTRGNNVDAYADRDGDDNPDAGSRASGGASLDFDIAIDLTQEPSNYTQAAVVNLFYWTNIIHDVMYQYGFDEPAGNFQIDNFGRGGAGGDDVRAEAQDAADVAPPNDGNCNANFGTPADGARPKMQMYQCDNTTPERDGDLDAGVIAHEYSHGISNRLTGGPAAAGCLANDEQMGEGWSDWHLLSLTQRATHNATDGRGVGTYLFGQAPSGPGIRNNPYSTDFAVNDHTYDSIKLTGNSPHALGEVWATMLWDLNWALIGDLFPEEGGASGAGYVPGFDSDLYSGNGGNNLAQQLIMDGMKLQGCSPGFIDGRDAILAADVLLTGGQNERVIWKTFARRGLGWSADQGGDTSDRTNGTEAFDMPPHLNRPPMADAGGDQTIECASPTGTEVALDGTGSSDPDESNPVPDVLTYSWSGPFSEGGGTVTGAEPTVTLAKGTHTITLTVTDEHGETDTDQVEITIEDTTPPVINLFGADSQVLECALEDYVDLGATAVDVCEGDVSSSIVHDASDVDVSAPGTYEVVYTVEDAEGNEATATRTVEVEDTTPPEIVVVSDPVGLWPPNHEYHRIFRDDIVLSASDACNTSLSEDDVIAASVSSDEPEDILGDGNDGATLDDIVIAGDCTALAVRSERRGDSNGRVYTTNLEADDGYNVGTAAVEIHVPLSRPKEPAVNDGPAYTVAGCTPVAPVGTAVASATGKDDAEEEAASQDEETSAVRTGAEADGETIPTEYRLDQSYPNPFNASAEIRFALPESEHVRLTVYDLLGREVQVLVDAPMSAGTHRVTFDASGLGSGTYIYRMEAGTFTHVRQMVLMK